MNEDIKNRLEKAIEAQERLGTGGITGSMERINFYIDALADRGERDENKELVEELERFKVAFNNIFQE